MRIILEEAMADYYLHIHGFDLPENQVLVRDLDCKVALLLGYEHFVRVAIKELFAQVDANLDRLERAV